MDASSANSAQRRQEAIEFHFTQWQERLRAFRREQHEQLKAIGTDPLGRIFHEHFSFDEKPNYAALLQSILTPDERDRLDTDPEFMHAWQVFIDHCWVKQRVKRAVIYFGLIVISFALLLFAAWAFPRVLGPKHR